MMLKVATKFQKAFDLLKSFDNKYVSELTNKKDLPTSSDWEHAQNLILFLKIFYETTLKLSDSLYILGNVYMQEIYGLRMIIAKRCQSVDLNACLMAKRMKKKT